MRYILLLALLVPFVGCDSDSEADTLGTFTVSLSGELSGSYDGRASFTLCQGSDCGGSDVDIRLSNDGLVFGFEISRTFGRGIYEFRDFDFDSSRLVGFLEVEGCTFDTQGGTITLTEVSEDRIAGSLDATLQVLTLFGSPSCEEGAQPPTLEPFALRGSFDAERAGF
ncbi:MAG: hypothetical protein AAF089_16610 [Bacteroidota bacterium]